MKYVLFAALSLASVFACAQESASSQTERYNEHKGLDVAKVISIKRAQDPTKVDGLVSSTMVYVDSAGTKHTLDYTILGTGLQSG
jgi:hypothetical protein